MIKVLLIEDDPDYAQFVSLLLGDVTNVTYAVTHVTTLAKGITAIAEYQPDLILLDLFLPDSDGLDTVTGVITAISTVPIVVLSANQDADLAIEIVKRGAQDFLVKGQGDGEFLSRAILYAIERKESESRLTKLSCHDKLTGLINRTLFLQYLEKDITQAKDSGVPLALYIINIDGFKRINGTLGYKAGDELLVQLAKRLISALHDQVDAIARVGDDEFAVLIDAVTDQPQLVAVADRIVGAIDGPFLLSGVDVNVTLSVGIAVCPDAGDDAEILLRHADSAMVKAKAEAQNHYKFYA